MSFPTPLHPFPSSPPVLSHPWERMAEAAYRKYPNLHSTSVSSLDTIERRATSGSLFSHRIFYTLWNPPSLVVKVSGILSEQCCG